MEPTIRILTPEDVNEASALSAAAGWNQRLEDWRMLVQIAPRGSFCAIDVGRIVATAIGIDYGGFGWIAMMLVDPAYRGRGVGAALLESAMAALPTENPIRLDATPLGRPLYQRFGFEDEAVLSRRVAEAGARRVTTPDSLRVRPLENADLAAIGEHDAAVFGSDRSTVLEWMTREHRQFAYIANHDGPPQYSLGRPGRLFDQIGPVVARDDETAIALVTAAAHARPDRPLVVDAFDAQSGFSAWLQSAGFEAQRPLFRMSRPATPRRLPRRGALAEYAILGPEFA